MLTRGLGNLRPDQAVRETSGDESLTEDRIESGVTRRSVLIGSVLSVVMAFLAILQQVLGSGGREEFGFADGFFTGALFFLFVLICLIGLLKRIGLIRSGLRPQELLVIFSMLLMVTGVAAGGLVIYLLPHMVGFTQYATAENRWESLVLPLLPDGLIIKEREFVKGFFGGLGPAGSIPAWAWVGPLCAWGVLLGALYFSMISVLVILRKRWVEQERLSFPLAQVPLALVRAQPGEGSLLRSPVFWAGFALPGLTGLTAILHRILPVIPVLSVGPMTYYTRLYRNSIGLFLYAHFSLIGVFYLVSMEVLGSILLFAVLAHFQIALIVLSGGAIHGTSPYRPYVSYDKLHQEALGALLVLVLVGLYEARHHLRDVFRRALGSAPEVNDADEQLSYRTAVIGLAAGLAFVCFWLRLTGISWWVVPIFVGLMLAIYLGVTRILAEAGVMTQAPLSPMQVILQTAGTGVLGESTAAGFFLAQPWAFPDGAPWQIANGPHVMASASTAMRLMDRPKTRSRSQFHVSLLALLLGGAVASAALLHFAYSRGVFGFGTSSYVINALNYHLNYYGGIIKTPTEGHPARLIWSGVGAAVMGLLTLARQRFFWWPIHPIGYAVGTILPSWWINVFVAWLIKRNVLKYGGPSLYGRSRAFFLGLILGQAVTTMVGGILAMVTGRA